MVLWIFQVWMYEYFGVGPKIREEVNDIYPRFLRWLPKYSLSTPSRHSLEIWCMVIDNLTIDEVSPSLFVCKIFSVWLWLGLFLILRSLVIFEMCLNPWVGCEEYDECEQALELNSCQVLFECGHGRYWYLSDWVLPQVQHVYPPITILVPPCPTIRLADLLTNEKIVKLVLAMLFQEYQGLILNLFKPICKVVWPTFMWHRYFSSLL